MKTKLYGLVDKACREWIDNARINRNIGWIVRVKEGSLVKFARVTSKHPPDYDYCCQP